MSQTLVQNKTFPTDIERVASYKEIRERAAGIFSAFSKFASVRNPWADGRERRIAYRLCVKAEDQENSLREINEQTDGRLGLKSPKAEQQFGIVG